MADTPELRVHATAPTGATEPLQTSGHAARPVLPGAAAPKAQGSQDAQAAASTGGQLREAYAQFVVDPDTHDVIVRIRDASTHRVIQEIPSAEVESLNKALRDYAEALARRRAPAQGEAGA
jgi:hypothetical protein